MFLGPVVYLRALPIRRLGGDRGLNLASHIPTAVVRRIPVGAPQLRARTMRTLRASFGQGRGGVEPRHPHRV